MEKNVNLYFKLRLTSNSPDSQIISLGMVSDTFFKGVKRIIQEDCKQGEENESKSFYAEFNDFGIDRCDDKVKENVVGKLKYPKGYSGKCVEHEGSMGSFDVCQNTFGVKFHLAEWLLQFKDYNIQFIGDKCSWEWVKLVELIGKWKGSDYTPFKEHYELHERCFTEKSISFEEYKLLLKKIPKNRRYGSIDKMVYCNSKSEIENIGEHKPFKKDKYGNPILPENISPEPMDLNTVIALKKGISVREAGELDRLVLFDKTGILDAIQDVYDAQDKLEKEYPEIKEGWENIPSTKHYTKHNSLNKSKIIKEIYQKLM